MSWNLVVHGGSGRFAPGSFAPDVEAAIRAALGRALNAGGDLLAGGGGALDAVEAAVRVLEDDPNFNAGRGAVFTADATNELDAAIMDGCDRSAGAVAGVTRTRNPVTLARAVMAHSPHVLLAREGADGFALEHGIEQVEPGWFATPERLAQLRAQQADGGGFDSDLKYGTVGAVACDRDGHLAAATSTGGLTGKRWARIGDSPLIGAGTWADDRSVAVSATGSGEVFIRVGVAHEISARVRLLGEDALTAARAVMAEVGALRGSGGVIVVGRGGEAGWAFDTPALFRGRIGASTPAEVALFAGEV